ncbi:MAG: inositol monophosphatase [Clostridiales bacterium]|nr:inositol monophosphatase [Clostridiales bacterium]
MDTLITQISAIVRECGDIILQADRGHVGVDAKAGHANFVTTYDRQVQKILQEKLLKILPEAVFVGEEEDIHASIQDGFAFIVDPIDGTTNFIRDYHVSAISVGITKDGERCIGVVYNPYLDEMFTAKRGEGAYLNGKSIHVSNRALADGIVIFGTAPYYEEYAEESFRLACDYFRKCADVRRSGSAALDLCNVAAGRAELFFELALSPWDHAAAGLIVEEAGGTVTTMDGKPVRLDTLCSVKATNGVAM